jgi:endo-alpha-1,4-polygalactosaminidase (GH114 family)
VLENPAEIERFQPSLGQTFEWRLDSIRIDEVEHYHCDIIDIDAFSSSPELVKAFHENGIKVFAYISVGTFETYRPDFNLLPEEIVGAVYPDWPDELFLDIRQLELLKPFIESRFDMIKAKGFDGIEPDNIDIYGEETGFDLTLDDTRLFCEYLITEAHERGLSIGQKNTEELVSLLYEKFDWALTEDAFHQNIEDAYSAYISIGKPVFSAEYTDEMDITHFNTFVCTKATDLKYFPFLKHRDLNQWTYACN